MNASGPPQLTDEWTNALVAAAETLGNDRCRSGDDDLAGIHRETLPEAFRSLFEQLVSSAACPPQAIPSGQLQPDTLVDVYQRILDYRPVWQDGRYRLQCADGLRKPSGSYFTAPALVEHLLAATLAPVVTARVSRAAFHADGQDSLGLPSLDQWTPSQREQAAEALLTVRACDPACGPGRFLLAMADYLATRLLLLRSPRRQSSSDEFLAARAEVIGQCLFGVDLDPLAIEIAQFSLWLAAGKPTNDWCHLAGNLRHGDSLGTSATEQDHLPLFDREEHETFGWRRDFPHVFRHGRGFDVVIGNPPFANAIEGLVDEETKARLVARYPEVTGTADLAYYFLVLAHRLTVPDGAVGLVLPRGVLTSRSTRKLRGKLLLERPPCLIYAPQDQSLFPGANIFVVLLALRQGSICLGSRDAADPRFDPIKIVDENWWAPLVSDTHEARCPSVRVGDRFEVFASMTTGMAYDLLPFVHDEPRKNALRLVTTGLIDPGVCHWGNRLCRYLKHRFHRPVIHETADFPPNLTTRLQRVRRPKVLVAGLSLGVEAFLDTTGEYCGAVSTYTIVHPEDDVAELARLCGFLNGPEATRQLQLQLGAHAMGGGRITLSKDFLRHLPYEET